MRTKKLLLALVCILPIAGYSQKTVKTYYDYNHTQVHEVYTTDNFGTKNGAYTEYSQYGGILQQGTYKNGKTIGKWIANDAKGKLLLEDSFDNDGSENGQVNRYAGGHKYAQENYKHGKKDGHFKYWYCTSNNQPGEPNFDSDPNNISVRLKADGTTQLKYDEYYKNDQLDSISTTYEENGKIGKIKQYKEGVQNGIEKDYTNGILTYQVNFINGKQDGELVIFDWDGSGYEMTKGNIKNGKKVGDWKLCFDSTWHQCFHKSQIAFYRLAKLSEDGSQTAIDYYITGEKEGERTYDASGKYISGIDYYKDGKLQEKYTWNPNTNKYDDVNYNEDGSVKVSAGK